MSVSRELGESAVRFKTYVDRLIALLTTLEVHSISALIRMFRGNDEFRRNWRAIWNDIAAADGGKISLAATLAVLGAVLGGVGIAAMGSAIGLPLALVLGLGGLIAGAELDLVRRFSGSKARVLLIPKPIDSRIEAAANAARISVNEIIVRALSATFPDPSEFDSPG